MQIDVDPEQDFHVVVDGAVKALSLDGLDAAYQADSINEETLIWQEGLDGWMRLDELLAVLGEQQEEEPPQAAEPAVDENTYSVMMSPDDVKSMTLEALAEAHRLGVVNEGTLVWQAGYADWVPLSVVIASFSANEHASTAPQHVSAEQHPDPASTAAAPATVQAPSTSSVGAAAPAPAVPPASPVAPVAAAAQTSGANAVPSRPVSAPNSLVPTASNIGPVPGSGFAPSPDAGLDDFDLPAFKGAGASWLKRSLIGVGSLAAVLVVYQVTSGSAGEEATQVTGAATQEVAAAATPEKEPEPSAWEKEQALVEAARLKDEAAAKAAANNPQVDAFSQSLTGEKATKKPATSGTKAKWRPKAKKASSSTKTQKSDSSQYDPMNGAL